MKTSARNQRQTAKLKCLQKVIDHGKLKKVKYPEYVKWTKDCVFNDSVICKLCGAEIQALRPHPVYQDKLVPTILPNYIELEIQTTRGKHVTPICRECYVKGLSRKELDEILVADMIMLDILEDNGYGENGWEGFADREAVTYKRGRF